MYKPVRIRKMSEKIVLKPYIFKLRLKIFNPRVDDALRHLKASKTRRLDMKVVSCFYISDCAVRILFITASIGQRKELPELLNQTGY